MSGAWAPKCWLNPACTPLTRTLPPCRHAGAWNWNKWETKGGDVAESCDISTCCRRRRPSSRLGGGCANFRLRVWKRLMMNLPSFSGSLGVRFIFRCNNMHPTFPLLLVISSELSPFSFLVKFSPGDTPCSPGPPWPRFTASLLFFLWEVVGGTMRGCGWIAVRWKPSFHPSTVFLNRHRLLSL